MKNLLQLRIIRTWNFCQRFSGGYVKVRRPDSTKSPKNPESTMENTRMRQRPTEIYPNLISKFLRDKIKATGPLTVAEYMHICATAPQAGYYTQNREILGGKGDFITSPEISQIFGELIGVWIINEVANMGHKGRFQLIELGPGTGALASDILRVFHRFGIVDRVSVHFVEISEELANRQEQTLCSNSTDSDTNFADLDNSSCFKRANSNFGCPIFWYKDLQDVPEDFCVIVGHEFFDALPVHCFRRNEKNDWREICIELSSEAENGEKFSFGLSRAETIPLQAYLPKFLKEKTFESVRDWEFCPTAAVIIESVAKRISKNGGNSLIIDYGHFGDRNTPSLRAYKDHKLADPLSAPGQVDITADVNFGLLKSRIESESLVFGPISQSEFLRNLGIELRIRKLKEVSSDSERESLDESFRILMDKTEMGERFKVMTVFPKTMKEIFEIRKAPAGFLPLD